MAIACDVCGESIGDMEDDNYVLHEVTHAFPYLRQVCYGCSQALNGAVEKVDGMMERMRRTSIRSEVGLTVDRIKHPAIRGG